MSSFIRLCVCLLICKTSRINSSATQLVHVSHDLCQQCVCVMRSSVSHSIVCILTHFLFWLMESCTDKFTAAVNHAVCELCQQHIKVTKFKKNVFKFLSADTRGTSFLPQEGSRYEDITLQLVCEVMGTQRWLFAIHFSTLHFFWWINLKACTPIAYSLKNNLINAANINF